MVRPGNDPEVPLDGRTLALAERGGDQREVRLTEDRTPEPEVLRGTSDQLVIAIAEVGTLEARKRSVRPSDPGFPGLALDVRRAAERVLDLARREELVARDLQEKPSTATLPPIERMTPAKELAGILEEWRAVEHELLAADSGSARATELQARFEELRDRYARILKERKENG